MIFPFFKKKCKIFLVWRKQTWDIVILFMLYWKGLIRISSFWVLSFQTKGKGLKQLLVNIIKIYSKHHVLFKPREGCNIFFNLLLTPDRNLNVSASYCALGQGQKELNGLGPILISTWVGGKQSFHFTLWPQRKKDKNYKNEASLRTDSVVINIIITHLIRCNELFIVTFKYLHDFFLNFL